MDSKELFGLLNKTEQNQLVKAISDEKLIEEITTRGLELPAAIGTTAIDAVESVKRSEVDSNDEDTPSRNGILTATPGRGPRTPPEYKPPFGSSSGYMAAPIGGQMETGVVYVPRRRETPAPIGGWAKPKKHGLRSS